MMACRREVYALVFAYLRKVDSSLARLYQLKTGAEPLDEWAPSLEAVVQTFLRTFKRGGSCGNNASSAGKRKAGTTEPAKCGLRTANAEPARCYGKLDRKNKNTSSTRHKRTHDRGVPGAEQKDSRKGAVLSVILKDISTDYVPSTIQKYRAAKGCRKMSDNVVVNTAIPQPEAKMGHAVGEITQHSGYTEDIGSEVQGTSATPENLGVGYQSMRSRQASKKPPFVLPLSEDVYKQDTNTWMEDCKWCVDGECCCQELNVPCAKTCGVPENFRALPQVVPTPYTSKKLGCALPPNPYADDDRELRKAKKRKTGQRRDCKWHEREKNNALANNYNEAVKEGGFKTKMCSVEPSSAATFKPDGYHRSGKAQRKVYGPRSCGARRTAVRVFTDDDADSGMDDQASVYSSFSDQASATDDLPSAEGDEWLPCDLCGRSWVDGDCMLHGPPISVPDTPVPADTPPSERAARSAPSVLRVGPSGVHRGGVGVWARRPLPAGLRFGPYRGRREPSRACAAAAGCSWEVHRRGRLWFCVDAADPARANWMRYVNCAASAAEENVTAYQHRWKIWYRTCRPIPRDTELLVYYGDEYKRELTHEAATTRKRRR